MTSPDVAIPHNLTQPGQAFELPNSVTHERVLRALAHYTTPEERELAIDNLKWLSVYAPTHSEQMDCRMCLLSMRNALSFQVR